MSTAKSTGDFAPFLLEIGSEEIPARFIPDAMTELETRLVGALGEAHLACEGVRVMATPRRLALMIERLSVGQPDREVVIKGPPVSVAFGSDGAPTPAGLGFARKAGVDLDACERGEDERGEFLQARRLEKGRPAAEILAEEVPKAVLGIPFRKTMRWGDHDLEYPRPLQWIVAVLGDEVVDLKVDYLASGRTSRGHRTLAGDRPVEIAKATDYVDALRSASVVVDHQERRRLIAEGHAALVGDFDAAAALLEDDELLTEVVFLCEHPTPFLGTFADEYAAALPAQVITTALKAHQRYFSIGWKDRDGLAPRFASVRDGGRDHLDNVVRGNERVLRARLADAMFYWTFDQKKTPDERVAQLGSVTWLEGFGTVLDKTLRLGRLTALLWDGGMGEGPAPVALARAAAICKSDLVSEMIKDGKEFTKLEGFIGARYAELAGETPEVCRAIENHYAPRSASGALPADAISAVLSVADRLDNVAGCWLAGFAPTGAKDPYALRRHVLAVVRILLDRDARVDLEALLTAALEQVGGYAPDRDLGAVAEEIGSFVRTRLEGWFVDSLGCEPELVRAVLPVRWRDPVDALAWIRALDGYREREDFLLLATGFKRCRNILKGDVLPVDGLQACLERWQAGGAGAGGEDIATLPEPAEADLRKLTAAAAAGLAAAETGREYDTVFDILSSLGPAIDAFFDQVRVNTEDAGLTERRLAFLREIHGLFVRYADFSAIGTQES
jgi:glycyl-tRNA synthetase beta chain